MTKYIWRRSEKLKKAKIFEQTFEDWCITDLKGGEKAFYIKISVFTKTVTGNDCFTHSVMCSGQYNLWVKWSEVSRYQEIESSLSLSYRQRRIITHIYIHLSDLLINNIFACWFYLCLCENRYFCVKAFPRGV